MKRTALLQEIRKMRFTEALYEYESNQLTQTEAARLLGVCDRTFRRHHKYAQGNNSGFSANGLTSFIVILPTT